LRPSLWSVFSDTPPPPLQGLGACRSLLSLLLFPLASDLPLRRAWLAAVRRPTPTPDAVPPDPETSEHDARLLAFQEATGMKFRSFGLLRQVSRHSSPPISLPP
jgi:hypothetical protein